MGLRQRENPSRDRFATGIGRCGLGLQGHVANPNVVGETIVAPPWLIFPCRTASFADFEQRGGLALPIIKVNSAMMSAMDIRNIPLFEALTRRMNWLSDRQTVLAENVANANTPGYTEKDLKAPDFSALVGKAASSVQLAATEPGHFLAPASGSGIPGTIDTTTDRTLNGNGVSIEAQMMKVSENAADYALTTTLYKQNLALFKTVLGGGGGG